MGIFSKKQKTVSTGHETGSNTSTSTITPNVPDWIAQPAQGIAGAISGLQGQGPAAFAPQTSGLQQQAFDAAGNLTNSASLGDARTALGGVGDVAYNPYTATNATAASLLDGGLDRYYTPFKDQVLNPVLSDYDEQSGITRAAQAAQAARNKAFQGSRYGIQEAATEGQLARGRAATEGGLLDRLYTSATGLAQSDAANRQQTALANAAAANAAASQNAQLGLQAGQGNQQAALERARQLASLGLSEGAETRANLGVQAGLGGVQTDQQNAARQYPVAFQGQMGELLKGLNPELFSGKTVNSSGTSVSDSKSTSKTSSSDLLGSLGQIAQIASLFMPVPKPA